MFWENFCELCRSVGKTPSEVVKELGLAGGSVTKWKNGTLPSKRSLESISAYFSVEPQMLFASDAPRRTGVKIPVYGNVAAGEPIEAITDIEDYEEIPPEMAATGEYIALRIHGDSMCPRMEEGDVVIVRLQPNVQDGEIAIVMIDDGISSATCKKIKRTAKGLYLLSLNPEYEPLFYSNAAMERTPVRILGRVVELRAKFGA